jgi:hypothetical protein
MPVFSRGKYNKPYTIWQEFFRALSLSGSGDLKIGPLYVLLTVFGGNIGGNTGETLVPPRLGSPGPPRNEHFPNSPIMLPCQGQ